MSRNKSPRLRFAGFARAWEEKKIGDVLTEVCRSISLEDDKKYQLVTVKRRNEGVVSRGYLFGKDILVKNYRQLKAGDYLISKRQIIHGANGLVPSELDNAIVSNEYLVAISNDDLSTEFLALLSRTPEMYRKFLLSSYGVDIEKMVFNVEDWKTRSINLPTKPEQTALGDFFRRLDETLAQARARLAKTRQLKRAMLAKLFPAQGETAPKLRFKGFSGDWERRALGEVAELYQPKTITGSDLTDSGYPVFGANGYIGFYNEANHFEDQVTISARGEGTGTPNYVIAPVWITGNSMVVNIDNNRGINKYFLHSLLSASSLKTYVTGGAQPQLTREVLTNVPLLFPTREEQTAIGNFFQKLDQTLALQSAVLEKLTQLKKALLAAMLV
jgi:restriction modification system, specificity subunit